MTEEQLAAVRLYASEEVVEMLRLKRTWTCVRYVLNQDTAGRAAPVRRSAGPDQPRPVSMAFRAPDTAS
jgi:ribosomal protein L30/L7E